MSGRQTTPLAGTGRTARGLSPFGSLVNHDVDVKCPVLSSPAIALLPHKRTKGQWESLGGQNHLMQWVFQLGEDCSQGCNLLGCEEETSPCSGTDVWQAQLPQ